jgi:hypothetical protein
MVLRVSANTTFSGEVINDNRHLLNIANTDATSASSIAMGIRMQNHTLKIYDSSGSVTKTWYFAVTPGIQAIV